MTDSLTLPDLKRLLAIARQAKGERLDHGGPNHSTDWPAALEAVCQQAIELEKRLYLLTEGGICPDDLHRLLFVARSAYGRTNAPGTDWPAALEAVCEAAIAKDECILLLANRLLICSTLLTRAAERLGWDAAEVQELVAELRESVQRESGVKHE